MLWQISPQIGRHGLSLYEMAFPGRILRRLVEGMRPFATGHRAECEVFGTVICWMPQLQDLPLFYKGIGNEGMQQLCAGLGGRALPSLKVAIRDKTQRLGGLNECLIFTSSANHAAFGWE